MLSKFKSHIGNHFSFLQNAKLLVACSGGLDSIVLSWLMHQLDYNIALAHCNFNLREEESDDDELFVTAFANDLDIDFYVKSFNTKAVAQTNSGSIQMIARDLRYKWFKELLSTKNYDYVLTAHHADDCLETFLINLSRGTGIEGLTGIPEQNDEVIRPLLKFSRVDILAYAKANNLAWREDSSNAETKYLRNKIRQELVPVLKNLNPNFLSNFLNTQERLRASASILDNTKKELRDDLFVHENNLVRIAIEKLEKLLPMDTYLYLLFKEYGFTAWKDIHKLLKAESGKEVHSSTHRLVKDRKELLLVAKSDKVEGKYFINKNDKEVGIPVKLKMEVVSAITETSRNILYLDMEKLIFPLMLRKWSKGDYFYPLGMRGKKKLSKYYKDEKVNVVAKEKQWLLVNKEEIVWGIGRRADERYKGTQSTKTILKITWDK